MGNLIYLKNVSYRYESRGTPDLANINLHIGRGLVTPPDMYIEIELEKRCF